MDELIAVMASEKFHEAIAEVAAEIRAGADLEPEEVAARLGIDVGILVTAAAQWMANETDRSFVVKPQKIKAGMQ